MFFEDFGCLPGARKAFELNLNLCINESSLYQCLQIPGNIANLGKIAVTSGFI